MNCSQANQLNINTFLNKLGLSGQASNKNITVYFSPLRTDKQPSFCVYTDSNRWHDYGTGENGDLVSLVQKLYTCSISQALQILSKDKIVKPENPFFSIEQKVLQKIYSTTEAFLDVTIQPLTNKRLREYLHSRGISQQVWSKQSQLSQITYYNFRGNQSRRYFTSLAWANDTGGYEIRGTGNFKSSYGHKDITTIPGTGTDLNLFEGFFDYMSALVYFKTAKLKNTTIVLNSLSNIKKARPAMDKAEIVNLWLDNDTAGIGAANNLQSTMGNCINRSKEFYPDHHDFNDLVKARLL